MNYAKIPYEALDGTGRPVMRTARTISELPHEMRLEACAKAANGQELFPDELRRLAAVLINIANESEARDMGKGYLPARETTQF